MLDWNQIIIALILTIPAIIAAWKANAANNVSIETKKDLEGVHKLVNQQLTEAVNRAAAAEKEKDVLKKLLSTLQPENPAVIALVSK